MKTNTLKSAFTLIELLTVIAIIGILAAILIPVVGAVRENARASQCVSNMRQMGQGIHMYAQDNGGEAPPASNVRAHEQHTGVPTGTSAYSTFHGSIWPYVYGDEELELEKIRNVVSEPNLFQCPTVFGSWGAAANAPGEVFYSGQQDSGSATYSYAMSSLAAPNVNTGVNLDTLTTSTLTVAVTESFYWNSGGNGQFYERFGIVPHNAAANFLFYDGHVSRLNRNEIPSVSDTSAIFWRGDRATN